MEQSQQKRTGLIVALLVILGLTAGAVVGLLLGWVVWPVQYTDTAIADLAPEYKDEYILLVAAAFTTDGDLEKAQARLVRLEVPNINQSLSALIDRYILEGRDEAEIRALVALANAQGVISPNMVAYLATNTPIPTDTPLPTPTPLPTDTPTVTPVPPTTTPPRAARPGRPRAEPPTVWWGAISSVGRGEGGPVTKWAKYATSEHHARSRQVVFGAGLLPPPRGGRRSAKSALPSSGDLRSAFRRGREARAECEWDGAGAATRETGP